MEYRTAVHEAGHAVAAESLGWTWTFHRGTADTQYLAKVTVDTPKDEWQVEHRIFIDLCGPYAELGLGEIIEEDYHWQFIAHMSDEIKAKHEAEAESFVYDNWSRIIELADRFVNE